MIDIVVFIGDVEQISLIVLVFTLLFWASKWRLQIYVGISPLIMVKDK